MDLVNPPMMTTTTKTHIKVSNRPRTTSHSLWDRLPTELKIKILKHCILTLFLNHGLTDTELQTNATEIWNQAFINDWDGDLSILPLKVPINPDKPTKFKPLVERKHPYYLPTVHTGLTNVKSKRLYKNLCNLIPELAATDLFESFLQSFKGSYRRSFEHLEQNLYHIPLRHCWLEELPEWLTLTGASKKLLGVAACGNHVNLFRTSLATFQPSFYVVNNREHHYLAMICFLRACENGCEGIVLELLHMDGINPSHHNNKAFQAACLGGYVSIIRHLWKHDSVRRVDLRLVLSDVIWNRGSFDVVKVLVEECQADPSHYEGSCLNSAIVHGSLDTVEYLIAFEKVKQYLGGAVVAAANSGQLEILRFLLEQDDVKRFERCNEDAFAAACSYGRMEVVNYLLSVGAIEPDVGFGSRCLNVAAENGRSEVVKFLLGLDWVDPLADECVVLSLACDIGSKETVEVLLGVDGMDPNARRYEAMFSAAKRGYDNIVNLLLDFCSVHSVAADYESHTLNGDGTQLGILDIIKVLWGNCRIDKLSIDFDILREPAAYGHKYALKYLSSIGINIVNGASSDDK
ncbi:hypothetical protein HDU76_007653 [Blyttiomyces sp. JEL0837]|nr:hypothetical protein HDU76_007653 [Blyttiomyces sp. JEL0837]